MRLHPRTIAAVVTICAGALLPGTGASSQSPVASSVPSLEPLPGSSVAACAAMVSAGSPLHDPAAVLIAGFADEVQAPVGTAPGGAPRFWSGDDLGHPGDPSPVPVFAIGNGRVIASGPVAGGGGIVVVEHAGPFVVPASAPGAPYQYPALQTDTVLSAYAGVDPSPDVAVGACVGPDTQLGVSNTAVHLELRLAATADPAKRAADWLAVGPATDSIAGLFVDPQVMVDDGLRDPAAFLASLAHACPRATDAGSPEPCTSAFPLPAPTPTPITSPAPTPTPSPIRSAAADLRAGLPATIRDTCVPRTTGLVTGTIAAVDCHPEEGRIKLLSYYLLRPADARFTFASRMRQYDLKPGADCHAGKPGIESKRASLSVGCFVDSKGRANLRFASRAACPAVYVGVLGTGGDIAALVDAYDQSVGEPWADPGSRLAACRSGGSGVSAPPAPTNVVFRVHAPTDPKLYETSVPDYRLEVTWDQAVSADTTIEVWAVTTCPLEGKADSGPCLTGRTPLPPRIRGLAASAPSAQGSVFWTVPGWEDIGGAIAVNAQNEPVYGIAVRALNASGASPFVLARKGVATYCTGCTY